MNIKTTTTILAVASLGISTTQAAVVWDNGGAGLSWHTPDNWDTNAVPSSADDITITTTDAITFNPRFGGDHLRIDGGSLAITGGSLTQGNFYGEDVFVDNGTMTLNNTTFEFVNTGAQFRIAEGNGDSGTVHVSNSTLTVNGELWLGDAGANTSQTAILNVTNSTLDLTTGAVGLWFWDTDAAGSSMSINVNGAGSTVSGRVGRRNTSGQANNVSWEALWDEGILQYNGGNLGTFADHFETSGTPGNQNYILTSVPEPSSSALLGLGGLALVLRRRK